MILAHIAGVPVEELLPLAYGSGGAWLAIRAWVTRGMLQRFFS